MPQSELTEIEIIFDEVVLISDPELRQSKLIERCAGNTQLRERIQSLLSAYSQGEFLETSAVELATGGIQASSLCGRTLGNYCLLDLLASGGMGEVYLARELVSPHAYVAIKLLAGDLNTRYGQSRFALEQELLQKLDHPGIVRLIEIGQTTDARPYIVMELVRGLPIDQFCDRAQLTLDKRMELIIQICQAMKHAHGLGIVHRDLKPSNILVQLQAGNAQIKIIDFGVAKCLGAQETVAASLTCAEQILGTPAYMSPEQLDWSADVSPQSDVYSIGAVLCTLLIGTTPLDAQLRSQVSEPNGDDQSHWADVMDIQKLRQALLHGQPARPSQILAELPPSEAEQAACLRSISLTQLRQKLPPQLDWIVLKALSPQRSHRYPSVAALSADLQAVLEDRPTTAGPPSLMERLSKWSNRNSHWLKNAAIGCLIVGILLGFWWAKVFRERLQSEADVVTSKQQLAQHQLQQKQYVADLRQSAIAIRNGDGSVAQGLLEKYQQGKDAEQFDTFALRYLVGLQIDPQRFSLGHLHDILDMDLSPDGKLLATCDSGGQILVRSVDSLDDPDSEPLATLDTVEKEVTRVRFSPDGKLLATTGQEANVRLWKTDSWELHAQLRCRGSTVSSMAWAPDGNFLAAGDRLGRLYVWESRTLERLKGVPQLQGQLRAIAWSPDGKTLAIAEDNQVSLWNPNSWQMLGHFQFEDGVLVVDFSPDSQFLAIGGYFSELITVDVRSCEIEQRVSIPFGGLWSIHFLEGDAMVVGIGSGHVAYLHRLELEKHWHRIREATVSETNNRIRRVVPLPDGQNLLVTLQENRQVAKVDRFSLAGFDSIPTDVSLVHDSLQAQPIFQESFQTTTECFPVHSRAAGLTAVAGRDDQGSCIGLFQHSTGRLVNRIPTPDRVRQLCFSPDGRRLSICGTDPRGDPPDNVRPAAILFHIETSQNQALPWPTGGEESRCAFTDTGRLLVAGAFQIREIACIDSATGELIRTHSLSSTFISLATTRDDQQVLIGQFDRLSCFSADLSRLLWSAPSPEMIVAIEECHDGRTIACLCYDGKTRLWDKESHDMLYELPYQGPAPLLNHPSFWLASPDPNTLIFGGVEMPESIRFQAR
jgi:serine/threonine protein kinase/WD40 repeat protein